MKKIRFSVVEKKLLREVLLFIAIQLVIIFVSARLFTNSQPTSIDDVKRVDITVDDTYRLKVLKETRLYVVSDSTTYVFSAIPNFKEASANEIYKSINEGDKLSLMYEETFSIFGKTNLVVDARSETQTFRTFEGYNKGKENLPLIVIIASSVAEIVFIGIIFMSVWLDRNILNGIYRKIKKYKLAKNKASSI